MPNSRFAVQFLTLAALMAPAALAQQITVYSSGSLAIGTSKQLTVYVPLATVFPQADIGRRRA